MDARSKKTAKAYGIIELCERLEQDLLEIEGVTEVEFDLDGFYDNLNQVIVLTEYSVQLNGDYFSRRREMVKNIIVKAYENGLKRTEDAIEDYGAHYYFVFSCGKKWRTVVQHFRG